MFSKGELGWLIGGGGSPIVEVFSDRYCTNTANTANATTAIVLLK